LLVIDVVLLSYTHSFLDAAASRATANGRLTIGVVNWNSDENSDGVEAI
jgi:hypothetical protein